MNNSIIFLVILSTQILSGCLWFNNKTILTTISSPLPKINHPFQPTIVWSQSVGIGSNGFYSDLHLAWQNRHVFAADRYGIVKALDVNNGKEIWSINLSIHTCSSILSRDYSAQLSGGIAVSDSRIYIGSELAKIYAINIKDGSIAWEKNVIGEVLSTPVISDSMVLIHTSNGMLQALNDKNGEIQWTIDLDVPSLSLRGESTPTIAFGTAIIGDDNGTISMVTMHQGQIIWQQRISKFDNYNKRYHINDIQATPVVINDIVYALAHEGNLVALDLSTGQVIWSKDIGSTKNLIVDNGNIYLVDQNNCIIALDANNGTILWRQIGLLQNNLTSPIIYNGYLIVGDSDGYIHWIEADNGRFFGQKKIDSSGLLTAPIIVDNKLIVQSKNGKVYAITY